jgi:hypothetical protein
MMRAAPLHHATGILLFTASVGIFRFYDAIAAAGAFAYLVGGDSFPQMPGSPWILAVLCLGIT